MSAVAVLSDPLYCGCEASPENGGPISVDAALRLAMSLVRPVKEVERMPLERAHGRVLAERVEAGVSLPYFDSSAMDGYAVRLADLAGKGPWRLPVAGRIAAGDTGAELSLRGVALRILTGAPVPPECEVGSCRK